MLCYSVNITSTVENVYLQLRGQDVFIILSSISPGKNKQLMNQFQKGETLLKIFA